MIRVEQVEDGIALLTLDRPEAANALTLAMVGQLRDTLRELGTRPEVRVLVLAAAGKVFCAGLDLKAVLRDDGSVPGPIENMALQEHYAGLMQDIVRAPFPVIAAIDGAAVGAGMGVALAADIRVAGPGAKFLVGAVKVALSAGECGISYHLPRLIGGARAYDLMLTGRACAAEEAHANGLVARLCADSGAVLPTALDLARQVAANSPYATKHTKQVMRANIDAPSLDAAIELENHVQCLALGTDDFREACQAFAEKRPPQFTGR